MVVMFQATTSNMGHIHTKFPFSIQTILIEIGQISNQKFQRIPGSLDLVDFPIALHNFTFPKYVFVNNKNTNVQEGHFQRWFFLNS
jgi:hypothetical protein